MERILKFLESIHPLSDQLKEHIRRVLKTKVFSKRAFLLRAGQVCQNIYFVEAGLVRCFYEKAENEICSWFMKEGDLIISVQSFFFQQASYENIQALEPLTVHYISFEELQFIYQKFAEFNYVGRVLTERYYVLSEQRLFAIRMQRAQERYEYMLANSPDLIQRVPTHFIASYLGITKETLSRVRSRK